MAEIRLTRPHDLDRLITMMYKFAFYEGSREVMNIDRDHMHDAFFGPDKKLYGIVALHGTHLVGFLNFYYTYSSFEQNNRLWIEDVFVVNSSRGQGIGKQMILKVREIAKDSGCTQLHWFERKNNYVGRAFFESIGAIEDKGLIYVKWH